MPGGLGGRWYGVFPATVTDIKDPDGGGRVKIALPWSPDTGSERYEAWARIATLMGGNNRGSWFVPDVDDEVLVSFEAGDVRRPFVLGGLWNGKDTPPESMDGSGNNYKKVLCSRNGVKVTLDDQDGQESFICETPGGQKITLLVLSATEDAVQVRMIHPLAGQKIAMTIKVLGVRLATKEERTTGNAMPSRS